jgi:hypothetical protein
LSNSTKTNTPLFVDDQDVISCLDSNLRRGLISLQNIAKSFGLEILPEKSEKMDFLGQEPVKCKIVEDKKCLQQYRIFKYLGCKISPEN